MHWINGGFYFGLILMIEPTSSMDWIYGSALVGHLDCRWVPLQQRLTSLRTYLPTISRYLLLTNTSHLSMADCLAPLALCLQLNFPPCLLFLSL